MKKILCKIVLPIFFISFCSFSFLGCSKKSETPQVSNTENNSNKTKDSSTSKSPTSKTFTDDKNACTVTAPSSKWIEKSNASNPDSSLFIANISNEEYLSLIVESKDSLPQIDNMQLYRDAVVSIMSKNLPGANAGTGTELNIDGHRAIQFELSGTLDNGYDVTFLITVVEGDKNIYQIHTWTLSENMSKSRNTFKDIAKSFKEL